LLFDKFEKSGFKLLLCLVILEVSFILILLPWEDLIDLGSEALFSAYPKIIFTMVVAKRSDTGL